MAVLAAGTVSRWRELATDELRDRVQQLVAARLDADHSVWRTIRRDPVLAARVRGVLSGMASSIQGTRDEHMRRVWIAAARTALEGNGPVPSPVRRQRSSPVAPTETTDDPKPEGVIAHAENDQEPASDAAQAVPAQSEDPAPPAFTSPPPPVAPMSASPRAPIPPMVFSGP